MKKGCFIFSFVLFCLIVGAIGLLVLSRVHFNRNQGGNRIVLRNVDDMLPPEASMPPEAAPSVPASESDDPGPRFSRSRSYCDEPFALTLSGDNPDASIYYTDDGSFPFPEINPRAKPYRDPIRIAETTLIRAVAIHPEEGASRVGTHSYFFLSDILKQSKETATRKGWPPGSVNGQRYDYGMDPGIVKRYSAGEWKEAFDQIPTVSIGTDQSFISGPRAGIYSNALRRGKGWERPSSLEIVYPDGAEGFQVNAGLRIRGGYTRQPFFCKHAFRLFFRSEYGDGKMNYALFGDDGAKEFDKIDLRTSQNYSWARRGDYEYGRFNTLLRDVFCRDVQGAMGLAYTRSRYYHLFLNGHYWGIFMTEERPEAAYGATYFGGERDDYDTIKSSNFGFGHTTESTDGDLQAWRSLWELARRVPGDSSNAGFFRLQGLDSEGARDSRIPVLLDVDNLIQYMLIIFYGGNSDSPLSAFMGNARANNWYALRNRKGDEGFRFFIHDAEHTLGTPDSREDRTGPFHHRNQDNFLYSNPQWIHQDLMDNEEYRMRFADFTHRHFFNDGVLTYASARALMEKRVKQFDKAIRAQSARWGDAVRREPYTVEDWREQIEWLMDRYLPSRRDVVLEQLKKDQLYPDVAAPSFSQQGGRVASGFTLRIQPGAVGFSNEETIYYTLDGSDPRALGGRVSPSAKALDINDRTIAVTRTVQLKARAAQGVREGRAANWSALNEAWFFAGSEAGAGELVLSRISYRPENETEEEKAMGFGGRSEFEFLELTNAGDREVLLEGLRFVEGIQFQFSNSAVKTLRPGERVYIVKNKAGFQRRFGGDALVAGEFENGTQLDNSGERLTLQDGMGNVLIDLRYDNDPPWPESSAHSVIVLQWEKSDLKIQYNDPTRWKGGTVPPL